MKVAIGRNFADVPPNKGLYRGSAKESIEVSIHSEELKTIPGELAAERVESLSVPTFHAGRLSRPRAQHAAGTAAAGTPDRVAAGT